MRYKLSSLLLSFVFIFNTDINPIYKAFALLIIVILYNVMMIIANKSKMGEEHTVIKIIFHIFQCAAVIAIFACFANNDIIDEEIALYMIILFAGVLNTYVNKTGFSMHLVKTHIAIRVVTCIINAILMFALLMALIYDSDDDFLHFLYIITGVGIFMVNAHNLLQDRKNVIFGIYVGLKFTVLMICILFSFETPGYLISICCFVFSIISILGGFIWKYKALRYYGLALSFISIIKLMVVDIEYRSTITRALCFLISGILCFAISMIYNIVNKRISDE
jgi:uncharacterized membrane protein